MILWLIAIAAGIAGALLQYGWGGLRRVAAAPAPVVLRAVVFALLAALLLDAPAGRAHVSPPWVALDASASMARGGDSLLWRAAVDSARAVHADSIFLFGDSLRAAPPPALPVDAASDVDPVVQRALASGRPVVVVSDGELPQANELRQLPAGSRVIVIPHRRRPDAAAADLDVPRAVVAGDTVEARLAVSAGSGGSGPGTARLLLDGRPIGTAALDSLAPYADRDVTFRVRIDGREGPAMLEAVVAARGDVEPRNDTLGVGVDIARQPGAVFVSTSPDYDARFALAVLRGAVALPTRAFYHLSPGNWRRDGSYQRVSEAEVRSAFRDAPVAILHGDTTIFGPPRAATRAPLALIVPASGDGNEWYASAAPVSPLSAALAGLPWDSLPPLLVGPGPPPQGQWRALEVRRGREAFTRAIVAGSDTPRRVVVVAASDLWRWEFRGGASADAYTALWGSIFDYLAARRSDRRAAVPDARLVRSGSPVFWRRGATAGTSAVVTLTRTGGPAARGRRAVDTLHLRFPPGAATVRSSPLPVGHYDVAVAGGAASLVVNASAELVPQQPLAKSGAVGGSIPRGAPPPARDAGWMYLLLVGALCAEWLLRRRAGLR